MEGIEIRPFESGDTEDVIGLWERCGLVRPWNDPRKDIARKQIVQPELFLVAEESNSLIGTVMAGYDGHRGWVNYLAVDPELRRRGLGRKLMAEAEQALLDFGCPKVNLQVRSENSEVLAFYERIGYSRDDVISFGRRLLQDD